MSIPAVVVSSINAHALARAYEIAQNSPDKSNQNGAIILEDGKTRAQGYNHFYRGVPPTDKRPEKYERIVHAEADACLQLAHSPYPVGYSTIMYAPWATCKACAIAILGTGIPRLVIHFDRCLAFITSRAQQNDPGLKEGSLDGALQNWQPAIDESAQWLKDGGCKIEVFRGPVPFDGTIQINGRSWSPQTLEFTNE